MKSRHDPWSCWSAHYECLQLPAQEWSAPRQCNIGCGGHPQWLPFSESVLPDEVRLAHELVERARAHAGGKRRIGMGLGAEELGRHLRRAGARRHQGFPIGCIGRL